MSRLPRTLCVVCLIALVTGGCASRTGGAPGTTAPPPQAPPTGEAEASLLERRIAAHMRFLASDALNGRGSGTRDEWIAATYIGAQLAALGVEPMGDDGWFVQEVGVQRFKAATPPVLTAGDRTYTRNTAFLVGAVAAARVSGSLQHFVAGTPVSSGAAVILPADTPMTAMSSLSGAALVLRKATAAQAGNWAQLTAQASEWLSTQVVGTLPSPPSGPTVLTLDAATHEAIIAMADGTSLRLDTELVAGDRTRTWNVVGRLTGTDPSASAEAVILSAHLDHLGVRSVGGDVSDTIYNGADDDASGVVAVIELARVLAGGPRPRRPVVFALFGSEESGGFGARYFVDRPVVPLTDIVADLQVEMIGRPDPKVPAGTLWLTGYERSTLGPQLAARGARLVQDPHPDQRFFERSDNIRFARRGVVAHTVSSFGLHGEYHQPSDEFRHVNIPHMRDAIASLVEPVRWLATTTEKPSWIEGKKP
ncbi:Bacterial leucyl aminopeptidase precursor [Luteitalea pratensis]|uniref:Bacterial leucyl aminopeptidase n=1 Tax=Luteitalea pratensis TaxID=1855912 RepID=A0A143PJ22_LUTPR|nr:M20/M25/M40 family metallo-hydrolase [Luteitalea pratensis]AMY08078.1 Bacterial leucyl aminopeptidase precursor [Luteitalea pratensis]